MAFNYKLTDYLKLHTLKKPSKVGVFYKFCIVSCQKTACWIHFEDKTIRKITQRLFTDIHMSIPNSRVSV